MRVSVRLITVHCSLITLCLCVGGCSDAPTGAAGNEGVQAPEELLANAKTLLQGERTYSASPREEGPKKPQADDSVRRPGAADRSRDAFQDERPAPNTINSYHYALQQLNTYLDQRKDTRDSLKLAPDELRRLKVLLPERQPTFFPDQAEWFQEPQRQAFTLLDAHHLDACFLFRDAAVALRTNRGGEGIPGAGGGVGVSLPYQRRLAEHAFAWVTRQMILKAPVVEDRAIVPASELLRRGIGTEKFQDRSRVFLALLDQLELPGCMVAYREETGKDDSGQPIVRDVPWIPGVLIGGEVYLFDTRLGLPVPGRAGGTATLREVLANPALLGEAFSAPDAPYDVGKDRLKQVLVLVPSSLSALSPRMLWLQKEVLKNDNPVILHQELAATEQAFQRAIAAWPKEAGSTVEVKLWTTRAGYPAMVQARYLKTHQELQALRRGPTASQSEEEKQRLSRRDEIVRRDAVIWEQRLRYDTISPRHRLPEWYLDLAKRLDLYGCAFDPDSVRLLQAFSDRFRRTRFEPNGARDHLLRGRLELAIDRLLLMETRLARALEQYGEAQRAASQIQIGGQPANLGQRLQSFPGQRNWQDTIVGATDLVRRMTIRRDELRRMEDPDSAEVRRLTDEIDKLSQFVEALWKQEEPNIFLLCLHFAETDYREHMMYFMALAKLEQAFRAVENPGPSVPGRLTPQQQLESAADWLLRYEALILPQLDNHWYPAVLAQLARCRAAQKRYADAIDCLERLERYLPDLKTLSPETQAVARAIRTYQKQANHYLIRELRKKPA